LSEKYEKYAEKVLNSLENHEIRALVDNRNETIGKKIREAEMNKLPYMLIVGEQEENDGTISVRKHSEGDMGTMSVDDFGKMISEEVKKEIKEFKV
jgi:threonyl-tRNA synthetase